MKKLLTLYKPILTTISLILLVFLIFRVLFIVSFWSRVSATEGIVYILLQGLRFDLITIGMTFGIPALLLTALSPWKFLRPLTALLIPAILTLVVTLIVMLEASTLTFISQYDARPNILFIEYLKYPREVFSTLLLGFPIQTVLAIGLTILANWTSWKRLRHRFSSTPKIHFLVATLMLPVIAVLMLVMIRSTTAHRPANPSTVAFSQDAMVNELPLNSTYTLLYAMYEHHRYGDIGGMRYGEMSDETMLSIIRRELRMGESAIIDTDIPTSESP